ncbi:MAG TPA: F0F1 ATP synthase subunit delta [Casimicrobiaceae bacterium]|jgi:F-type H+-transporting ATPase subunit delta
MSEQVTIARPYAEAAFALAREQNALPKWAEMLKLASNVASDPTVRAALDNPRLDNAAKESLLLSLCGDALSAEGKSFIRVLLESDRIVLLPDIRALFDTLKDSADGVARAQIVSAFELEDAQLASLKAALEKRFSKTIEATVSVDPQLIGGALVTVGDTVIDASVRGELQAMSSQLRV